MTNTTKDAGSTNLEDATDTAKSACNGLLCRQNLPIRVVYGDGIHDDTDALQNYLDNKCILVFPNGENFNGFGKHIGRTFLITNTLYVA